MPRNNGNVLWTCPRCGRGIPITQLHCPQCEPLKKTKGVYRTRDDLRLGEFLTLVATGLLSLFGKVSMTAGTQDVSHLADSADNIDEAFSFEGAGAASPYHKWTVCVSIALGGIGAALGLVISVIGLVNPLAGFPLAILVFAPLGLLTGIAIMCLFAPKTFLQGSVGRVWMNVIGVQTVFAARLVCLLFLTILGFFLVLGLLSLVSKKP